MSIKCPTPHINATKEDVARTVLMPGDPLRAKLIAEKYLENATLFNNIRGIQGYTGTYKGVRVSVMASGMGMPSMGIYSYELFNAFDVENIIRIGSAGAMQKDIKLRDVLFGMGASTNSAYASQYGMPGTFSAIADFTLLRSAVETAEEMGVRYRVGNLLSSDTFYDDDPHANDNWIKMGVMAVEMEAAALYMNAARSGKRALAICTVSDQLINREYLTADERQNTFDEMLTLALNLAVKLDANA